MILAPSNEVGSPRPVGERPVVPENGSNWFLRSHTHIFQVPSMLEVVSTNRCSEKDSTWHS